MRLKGKAALVTAAGAGIGRACAEAFAAEGADVLAIDLNADALRGVRGVRAMTADATKDEDIARVFAALPRCDVVLNAVGVVPNGTVLDSDVETFNRAWDLNVVSMIRVIRAALPGMLARKTGAIVNIASVASSITGVANRSAYGTTKAAVIGLTKSVAADFVAQGVRCNAICPGTVDTPSLRARAAAQADPAAALERFKQRQPMLRLGAPEEIAATAVFLASEESAFLTGQAIAVDGGWTT